MGRLILPAFAAATLAGAASAQTSVDIRTGPNGQLSGSASAGGASSRVDMGDAGDQRVRSDVRCTGNGRTVTVTSPDGSSSSSSSVSSSGDGVASVGGGGSAGSRVRYGGCGGADTGATSGASSSVSTGPVPHHRRRTVRHH